LPPLPSRRSPKTLWTSCSPMPLTPASPKPKRPLGAEPFFVLVLESGPCGHVNKQVFF
jgi:hypothetical protein